MNLRRTKHGLWFLTFVFTVSGAASIIVALWLPYTSPETRPAAHGSDEPNKTGSHKTEPNLPQFTKLWGKDLRPPLFDPPTESVSAPDTATIPIVIRPNIRLIGYAVESDRSLAILAGPDGAVEFKAVGEIIHGVAVRSISPEGVLMSNDGDDYLLEFEDDTPQPAAPTPATQRAQRSQYNYGRSR